MPVWVRGPVDFWELRRLAASLRGEILNRFFGARGGREMDLNLDLVLPGAVVRPSINAMLIAPPLVRLLQFWVLVLVRWRVKNVRRKIKNILGFIRCWMRFLELGWGANRLNFSLASYAPSGL